MFGLRCSRRLLSLSSYMRMAEGDRCCRPPGTRSCGRSSGSGDQGAQPSSSSSASSNLSESAGMGQLQYEGSLTRVVRGVKLFSLSTSSLGLAIQCILFLKMSESGTHNWVFVFAGSIATIVLMSPLLLHYITKRYVTHLYYEPESRTFTSCSLTLLNRKRVTRFKAEDVVIPLVHGPFTTFTVFRKPYFIDPLAFKDISVFEHLVGYDKLDERLRGQERAEGKENEDQTHNASHSHQADQTRSSSRTHSESGSKSH